jgi:peptide-methionine (S)-S-oxide reductase
MAAQPGVLSAVAGFSGGWVNHPTYKAVCAGGTGHVEAVQLAYDPTQTSYDTLLLAFWAAHDPCSLYRQGADAGAQYSPWVFTHSSAQLRAARQSRQRLQERLGREVQTRVMPAGEHFWEAGREHQR